MSTLPLLLCGPVLRRVEPRSVSVWVALSESRTVRLDLWADIVDVGVGASVANPPRAALATASVPTRRVGDKLHVALVTLTLGQAAGALPLLPGTMYSYNVTFVGGAGTADLRSLGLLQDQFAVNGGKDNDAPVALEPLGYANGQLPAFATTPAKLDDLHVVHCSCSKLHGNGESMLPQIDDLIKDVHGQPLKRPHQMFLTGDQIYADDVASCLLAALIPLGKELLGSGSEKLPVPPVAGGAGQPLDATAANFPVSRRQVLVDNTAKLTSEDAANHLLSFGEFAAMYVLNWSPAAWNFAFKDDLTFEQATGFPNQGSPIEAQLTPLFKTFAATDTSKLAKATAKGLVAARAEFSASFGATDPDKSDCAQERVKNARDNIWKVRRALANVPTYCICDDHEVTDDVWLTQGWRGQVLGNALGRAIVRNAYAAYVLFQGWGNDPVAFATAASPGAKMLDAVFGLFPSGGTWPNDASMNAIDPLLGFGAQPAQLRLDYVIDGSAHRALVMDSRTRRAYSSPWSPPALLSDQAIQDQIVRGPFPQPLPAGLEVLFVISPAPMFGPPLMEDLLQPLVIRGFDAVWLAVKKSESRAVEDQLTGIDRSKPTGDLFLDAEGWSSNPVALEKMLAALAGYACPVVILAGDVHYASSHVMDYKAAGKAAVRFVHLTASAAQNAWEPRVCSFMSSISWSRALLGVELPARRFGWATSSPSPLDSTADEPPPLVGRAKRSPVLLSDRGWRHHHAFQRPPDWVWSLDQLRDTRNDADRPPNARPQPMDGTDLGAADPATPAHSGLNPAPGQLGYSGLAKAHATSMDRMFLARGVLFANNFGHVSFSRPGGVLSVTHELHSKRPHPAPNEDDEPYTVHTSSLVPTAPSVPAGIGPP